MREESTIDAITSCGNVEVTGNIESGITINAVGEAQPYVVIFVAPTEEAAAPILQAFDDFIQESHRAVDNICKIVNGQCVCGNVIE